MKHTKRLTALGLLAALLSTTLTACHSSVTEMQVPSGPYPTIRYGTVESVREEKMVPITTSESDESVVLDQPFLDYQAKMQTIPNAVFYDCENSGYDDVKRLMYYYYRIAEPMGTDKYNLHTFVGCVNVISGKRIEVAAFSDVVRREVTPVGGEEYSRGEVTLKKQYDPSRRSDTEASTIADAPYPPSMSIIETPGSDDIRLDIADVPDFKVRLMDTGDLFVIHKSNFWVYRYAESSGFTCIYEDDFDTALWSGDALDMQAYKNAGWSVTLEDVMPVYVTEQYKFDNITRTGEEVSLGDLAAVTDIIFVYMFLPPGMAGENADPVAPDMNTDTGSSYRFGDAGDDSEGPQPFCVPIQYRRDVKSKVTVSVCPVSEKSLACTQSRSTAVNTRKTNLSGSLLKDVAATYRDGNLPEVHLLPIGDPLHNGFVLISTPRSLTVYDGHSSFYRSISTEMTKDEVYGYIREAGGDVADYTDRLLEWEEMYMNFSSAIPYSGNSAAAEKAYILRGTAVSKLLALDQISRAEMSKIYSEICALHYRWFTSHEIHSVGASEKFTIFSMEETDDCSLQEFNEKYLMPELEKTRDKQNDALLEKFSGFMVPFVKNATWDYDAMLLSQTNAPAYTDANFLKPGYTAFPNALFALAEDAPLHEAGEWSTMKPSVLEEGWSVTDEGRVTAVIEMREELRNTFAREGTLRQEDRKAAMEALQRDDHEEKSKLNLDSAQTPAYDQSDTPEIFGMVAEADDTPQTAGGPFSFVYPTIPLWRIDNGNLRVYSDPTDAELTKISVESIQAKAGSSRVALHASLENGLGIYAMTDRQACRVSFFNGDTANSLNVTGQLFLLGSRFQGSYYGVYGTTLASVDCILLGFRDANRTAIFNDLRNARILGVKLSGSEAVAPNWVMSS